VAPAHAPPGAADGKALALAPGPGVPGRPAHIAPAEPARMALAGDNAPLSGPSAPQEHSESAIPIEAFPDSPYPDLEYRGSTCEGVFVYLVTVFEDSPRDSAVSFAPSAKESASFARPGQKVGDWEVLAITETWSGMMPIVWLARDAEVCRVGLTGNVERVKAIQAQTAREEAERQRKVRRRRRRRR
jgi:hypothetical protein